MASFEGLGYGLMNDALGFLRSDEGYALPSRYEIEIGQPKPMGVAPASGGGCLLYTSPSPRDLSTSRMPSSA